MEQEIFKGLPTLSLLPLVNTDFKVIKTVQFNIPKKGVYNELSPEIFLEDSGEFNLLDDNKTLYLPSITKVLLAVGKYPELKQNQIFTIASLEFEVEFVTITGSILEILRIEAVKGS